MSVTVTRCRVCIQDAVVRRWVTEALVESGLAVEDDDDSDVVTLKDRETLVQWSDYEAIDFDLVHAHPERVIANAYIYRKALIRKHLLAQTVHHQVVKDPTSILRYACPKTWTFECAYSDELDELLQDELYDLRDALDRGNGNKSSQWYILKPAMTDRGVGIKMFNTLDRLYEIMRSIDDDDDDDDDNDENLQDSGLRSSTLRHFVIQAYLPDPLLLHDPPGSCCKFHIRAYVIAVGGIQVYLCDDMLLLRASLPYQAPQESAFQHGDWLHRHLTNTCLQEGDREALVYPFEELNARTACDIANIEDHCRQQIVAITGAMFEAAARTQSTAFQVLPNVWEVFGVDFLVDRKGVVSLLEVNAYPDFRQCGSKLSHLVKRLFSGIVRVVILPFIERAKARPGRTSGARTGARADLPAWPVKTSREGMTKCLDLRLRADLIPA